MKLLYIDLFCGAGGTSTGVENARHRGEQCAKVIACVNHDPNAIASHAENHPDALHFTEDIRTLELSPLVAHVVKMRALYPDALVVLWTSLECTNFSKAKGGQPRDADSRTLAEHLFRYIEVIKPEYIQIENVEEFMSWGDLDKSGKPISRDAGRLYQEWVGNVRCYGYTFQHRILNSADFGAYTSRKRFFGIFAAAGLPIVFPEPTHTKNPTRDLFSPTLQRWKPVREVLDFDDEGESIFGRKKPLVDATLERIYAGLIKFVAGGKEAFLIKYNSLNGKTGKHIPPSIDDPCPVVSTQGRLGVAKACFLTRYNSGDPADKNISIDKPCGTLTTENRFAPVQVKFAPQRSAHFLTKHFSGKPDGKSISVDAPAGAITCRDHHSFISAYYGRGHNHSINAPAPTLTTRDRLAFVDMQYGNGTPSDVESPAPTLTTNPKHKLVTCEKHYLLNPQYTSAGGSVDNPCFTLIARMDKMPPYLVATETGNIAIRIEDTDTPAMVKIKEFMALYCIVDIKMRMLRIPELKQIMGFPKDYKLIGSQADQKKFIGNAVEVNMARVLCEVLCAKLIELKIKPLRLAA
jgi:DNA (cytosine-5)-methyltransferase 1